MDFLNAERTKKHDIPMGHLEFSYIKECSDIKELEKIIKLLRSGEEGTFLDLQKCAEERLAKLAPNSRLLRKATPITKKEYLDKEERAQLDDVVTNWNKEMSAKDKELKAGGGGGKDDLPAVRGQSVEVTCSKQHANKSEGGCKKNKSPMPKSHREWDKVDIDAELAKVDDHVKPVTQKSCKKKKKPQAEIAPALNDKNLTDEEKTARAEREKDKGNEAFRSGDYEEAVLYYTRSLSLIPTAHSYNNRAQAYIKLTHWSDAISDCNHVLKMSKDNIKALLRRATAYQGNNELKRAKADLQRVLEQEPHNKRAQDILEEVNEGLQNQKSKGRRMKIEEVDGGDDEGEKPKHSEQYKKAADQSKKSTKSKKSQREKGGKSATSHAEKSHKEASDGGAEKAQEQQVSDMFEQLQKLNKEKESLEKKVLEQQKNKEEKEKLLNEAKSKVTEVEKSISDLTNNMKTPTDVGNGDGHQSVDTQQAAPPFSIAPTSALGSSAAPSEQDPVPADVDVLRLSGNEKFKMGQYSEALDLYTTAVNKLDKVGDKHSVILSTILSNRAACCLKVGDCEGCVRDCTRALNLNPQCIKALIRRATAYETMEKYRKAYVEYRQVLSLLPQQDGAQQGMTRCANMLQQMDGAKWRDKLPATTQTVCLPPELHCTAASQPQHRPKHAVPPQRTAQQKFADHKAAGNNHVQQGRFKEAIDCYTSCIELLPDEVIPYTNRALCYLKLQQATDVITDCTKALQLDKNCVKALYRRAQAYRMQKQYREGMRDLAELLKINPKNTAAREELRQTTLQLKAQEKEKSKEKKRIQIEEVEDSDSDDGDVKPSKPHSKQSQEPQANKQQKASSSCSSKDQSSTPAGTQPTSSKCKRSDAAAAEKRQCTTAKKPVTEIRSAYDFIQQWSALKETTCTDDHIVLLRHVDHTLLPKYVSNMLDSTMLSIMIQAILNFINLGESSKAYGILENLSKVSRFKMVIMFMTDNDKNDLKLCFKHLLEAADCDVLIEDLKQLKMLYSLN